MRYVSPMPPARRPGASRSGRPEGRPGRGRPGGTSGPSGPSGRAGQGRDRREHPDRRSAGPPSRPGRSRDPAVERPRRPGQKPFDSQRRAERTASDRLTAGDRRTTGDRRLASDRPGGPRQPEPGKNQGKLRPSRPTDRPRPPGRRAEIQAPSWKPGPDARIIRAETGDKLGRFLARGHAGTGAGGSARQIKKWLELGCCRINGRIETFASRELAYGDVVEFSPPATDTEHRFDPRRILHDADGVLAYDKPAWLPVTRTDAVKSWSLTDILKAASASGELAGTDAGPSEIIPVHRLDADTSGIVLFSRYEDLARKLEALFAEHQVAKEYLAIVRGHPREEGRHRSYLVKVEARQGTERWRSGHGADAREAVTTWRVEGRIGPFASRVRVRPETGRHHQIRLHFSELGHPIYGDLVYGDRRDPVAVNRHLLHAAQVTFVHPDSGAKVIIHSRPPAEFAAAEKLLRKAKAGR
ncbi:hypothetical protein LBMAG53_11740 [Planctomycetota bacterium]|nr:hypothetical protein LBMAG53_11740 [Planctomycetota bacterium]